MRTADAASDETIGRCRPTAYRRYRRVRMQPLRNPLPPPPPNPPSSRTARLTQAPSRTSAWGTLSEHRCRGRTKLEAWSKARICRGEGGTGRCEVERLS